MATALYFGAVSVQFNKIQARMKHEHLYTSDIRCTFYTCIPVLNSKNAHLSNFVPKTYIKKLNAS
jgi:hypothetical protein